MKETVIGSMTMNQLPTTHKDFLTSLLPEMREGEHGICVFMRTPEGFRFISDFKMPAKANKRFEKEAPEGLYRGGIIVKVTAPQGILVVPDERYGWFKPFAGIARFDEGLDLPRAGARELIEEAFVYNEKKTIRFVPVGFSNVTKDCSLGFTVEAIMETSSLNLLDYSVNETNRALEAVLEWDITSIEGPFSVSLEEKWWNGGRNGVSVYAISRDKNLLGVFSGQQGFIRIPQFGIHENLSRYL